MSKGAYHTDCVHEGEYDVDLSYYIIIWDDPNCFEIRSRLQLITFLGHSLACDTYKYILYSDNCNTVQETRDIREILVHLDKSEDQGFRKPSQYYVGDDEGYTQIRRIITAQGDA